MAHGIIIDGTSEIRQHQHLNVITVMFEGQRDGWLARITGTDRAYDFAREFVDEQPSFSTGRRNNGSRNYDLNGLANGVYEVSSKRSRMYFEIRDGQVVEVLKSKRSVTPRLKKLGILPA